MYDGGKIIPVLVIFLILITSPIWYNMYQGRGSTQPDLVIQTANVEGKDVCVLPAEEMRHKHMAILDNWRDTVVRGDSRITTLSNGKEIPMSLTNSCLDCHSNKDQFCDQCHTYMNVDPYCWDCHVIPGETDVKEAVEEHTEVDAHASEHQTEGVH